MSTNEVSQTMCSDKKTDFFFKQKTAYEVLRSLVGSEMCIRDSLQPIVEFSIKWKMKMNYPCLILTISSVSIPVFWELITFYVRIHLKRNVYLSIRFLLSTYWNLAKAKETSSTKKFSSKNLIGHLITFLIFERILSTHVHIQRNYL